MNDAIACEKCGYDLFMINPDGLTVCNQCGEFSTVPNVPPAIDDETKRMVLELCEKIEEIIGGKLAVHARQIRVKLEAEI